MRESNVYRSNLEHLFAFSDWKWDQNVSFLRHASLIQYSSQENGKRSSNVKPCLHDVTGTIKSRSFFSGTGTPGWSRKKGRKTVVVVVCSLCNCVLSFFLSVLCSLCLPVIIKVLSYLSAARCKWFTYGPTDATATPSSLASLKPRFV